MTMSSFTQPFCTASSVGACDPNDLTKMPVKLFAGRSFTFPMSAPDIAANFPETYEVFRSIGVNGSATVAGGQTVYTSNMMGGDEVPCPFLCCGFCVEITPELEAWSLNGAVVDVTVPANAGPDTPVFNGEIANAGVAGIHQGVLEFGGATWRAAVQMLLGYNLRFMLQCKYELFNIPLVDIGCLDSAGPVDAAGGAQVPAGPGIQAANAQYAALGLRNRFLPPNMVAAGQPPAYAPAPVANVMRGGPVLRGGMSGWYLCPAPVLLAPCCRINLSLTTDTGGGTSTAAGHLARLRYEAADQSQNPAGYAPEWTNGIIAGQPAAGAAFSYVMKVGQLDVKILMVGYNLTLKACEQYFSYSQGGPLIEALSNIPGMPGLDGLKR